MEKKIRAYIDRKLVIYPDTKKMVEFQQKLQILMLDKYRDCQNYGMSAQKSYELALSVMNNFTKEAILYSEKVKTNMMCDTTSYMLFAGIA